MRKEGNIDWKGERDIGRKLEDIASRSRERYSYALKFIDGKNVLDIACGCGYGTNMLASKANSAIGADISSEAILYAREHWSNNNEIDFHVFDLGTDNFDTFPFEGVDTIVSIETIEHIAPPILETCKKFYNFLPDGGMLILSHPNRVPFKPHYYNGGTSWHLHFNIDADGLTSDLESMGFNVIDRYYQPNQARTDLKRNHFVVLEKVKKK